MNNLPIGIFDSGVGGLTVLESLVKVLPNEDYIYVADQSHCPYGTKTDEEIFQCALNVVKYLEKHPVKLIVIACNTASLFKDELQRHTEVPIVSVIEPTIQQALNVTKNNHIGIIATIATINKGAYQNKLLDYGQTVWPLACSEFVDFIEKGDLDEPTGQVIVNQKLSYFQDKKIDTLIHGCTHFGLLEPLMRNVLGDINYVSSGQPVSIAVKEILLSNKLQNVSHQTKTLIYTTGDVQAARNSMQWLALPHDNIKKINLEV